MNLPTNQRLSLRSPWKPLIRTRMICKLHLKVSQEADKKIFITCHEQGLNYHISFATVVEVITKPQIASTRMLFVINVPKRVTWQKCVAVDQLGLKFQRIGSSDNRPIQKRTLRPQGLTIWMQAQMKMNTIYSQ